MTLDCTTSGYSRKKKKTHQCTGSDPKSCFVANLVLLLQKVASFRTVKLIVGVRYLESAHFGDFFCGLPGTW